MRKFKENDYSFFLKPFFWSWGIGCLVYSFMIFQFWWGNHDWDLLKQGVNFSSGLFEARYSQFVFSVILLDGHTLPSICHILFLGMLAATGVLSASYLKVPRVSYLYTLFALFIVLNSHNFVLFYYVYLLFSFGFWALVSVILLILFQKEQGWRKFLLITVGLWFILGGYPPIISFYCTLFMARQIIDYQQNNCSFVEIFYRIILFVAHVLFSVLLWKISCLILVRYQIIRENWYNLNFFDISNILENVLVGWFRAICSLFVSFSFLDAHYYLLLAFVTISSLVWVLLLNKDKRWGMLILVLGMLSASYSIFIVAEEAQQAASRLLYWSRLGLYLFSLSILFNSRQLWLKNVTFMVVIGVLVLFININYGVMKNDYLGFKGSESLYARVLNSIEQNAKFNPDGEYIAVVFGQPNYRMKYFSGVTGQQSELLEKVYAFVVNIGSILFFDTAYSPVAVGLDIQADYTILQMDQKDGIHGDDFLRTSMEEYHDMRLWLYRSAKIGSGINSVYIGDKYLFIALNALEFYKNREKFLQQIKKWASGEQ